jgi:hypothetical protein
MDAYWASGVVASFWNIAGISVHSAREDQMGEDLRSVKLFQRPASNLFHCLNYGCVGKRSRGIINCIQVRWQPPILPTVSPKMQESADGRP